MGVSKTGSAGGANTSSNSSSSGEDIKKCIVKFWPCQGWKGEYGFDWFRTEDDPIREEVDSRGTKASSYYDCIGKYTGGRYEKLVFEYHKEGERVERKTEIRKEDSSVFDDFDNKVPFATYYFYNLKMRIPVVKEGEQYSYYYYVPAQGKHKTVKFNHNVGEFYYINYVIEYEGDKLQKLCLFDKDKNRCVELGPGDKHRAKSKEIRDSYHTDKKLIDRIYSHDQMFRRSLELHPQISDVQVELDSYRELVVVFNKGNKRVTQTYEFENRQLFNFIQRTDDDSQSYVEILSGFGYDRAKKKAEKAKVDEALLDPELSLSYVADMEDVVSGTLTMNNAEGKKAMLEVNKTMKYGEEELTIKTERDDEDPRLYPYWKDYFNGRGFAYYLQDNFEKGKQYYFYPTLSLTHFDGRDKRRGVKSEAKLQVTIEGDYKEITFESSHSDLEISPKTLKGNGTVTVKLKGPAMIPHGDFGYGDHKITAKSEEGKPVGLLKVMAFHILCPLSLDIVNINLVARQYDDSGRATNKQYPVQSSVKSSRRWGLDDEDFIQLASQGGVNFKDLDDQYQFGMEYEMAGVYTTEEGKEGISYDVSATELDMVTGEYHVEVPGDYLDFDNSVRMFERYTNSPSSVEGERSFDSELVATKRAPTLPAFIDQRAVEVYNAIVNHLRIYLIDRYLSNHKEGDELRYYDGYVDYNQRESILIFKKSIEANEHIKCNAIAHELFKAMSLGNLFSNQNEYTFKAGTTTNVMDGSDIRYSLNNFQWRSIYENSFKLLKHVWSKIDYTMAMIEEHTYHSDSE